MKNPLEPQDESKVLAFISTFRSDIRIASQSLRDVWLELYKNYRIFKSRGRKEWQSKVWVPKTFMVIEQIASRTTAHNPKFNLVALQASALQFFTANQNEIDEALASEKEAALDPTKVPKEMPEPKIYSSKDVLEAYLTYVFTENKLKHKIRLWDKGRLTYGTYHVKIDPNIITKKRSRKEEDENEEREIEEEVFSNILPNVNTVDVFDFDIHPFEESIDTAYGVGHSRSEVTIGELDEETYFNLERLLEQEPVTSDYDPISQKINKDNVVSTNATKKINPNSFGLYEYHGRFSLSGKPEDEKEYIISVVDDSVVVRFEEMEHFDALGRPVRPFVAMHDQPVPGEYFAIGEAEPIMSLQEEINNLRNTRMDYNNSVLYPEWLVRKGSGINPFQLVHRPNNIIQATNLNDIQPLQKSVVPQSGYQEEEIINRDIQDVSSTTNYAQPGATSAFTDTVTGASMRTQEQSTRMRMKIEYLDDAVAELGRKILLIAAHYIEDHIEIRKDDAEFITVYKEAFQEMARSFSPQVVTGSMAADTPSEKRNEAIARGNISLQYAQAGVPVNLPNEYKNIMESGFNVKDIDSLLGDTTAQPILEEGKDPNAPPPPEGQPPSPPMEQPLPPNPEQSGPPQVPNI